MAVMGVSAITPVFPAVMEALDIPPEAVGLLVTVYALPGIFFMPVMGMLADRIGRKQVLVPALVLFAVAGSACALARDFQLLLILRFFQGLGGASLGSLTATLIGDLYHHEQRTEAMGYKASVLSLGSALYPSIGGALAILGWYVPFALPILGLAVAWAVLFLLNTPPPSEQRGFSHYLGDALRGMRKTKVLGLYLATLLSFVVLYGAYMTFIPLFLAERFGSAAPAIGPVMTVGSLATAFTASRLGLLSRFLNREVLLTWAFALFGLSFLIIPWLPGYWWMMLAVSVFGVGQGFNYPVVLSLLAGIAPEEQRAIFMSLNGTVIRIGQAMGPLIMAGVFAMGGMDGVFYVSAGICGGVFLLLPFLIGRGER
jgi:predicted MFS family arabinose efflux permease